SRSPAAWASRTRRHGRESSRASKSGDGRAREADGAGRAPASLFRSEAGGVDHPMPPFDVIANERAKTVARGRHREDHLRHELRLDGRRAEDTRNLLVQILDNGRRRSRGRIEAKPKREVEILYAALGKSRDVCKFGKPVMAGHGQCTKLPLLDMLQ